MTTSHFGQRKNDLNLKIHVIIRTRSQREGNFFKLID